MDTELAKHLSDLNESLGRIDERCVAIHDAQEDLTKGMKTQEDRNRADFKAVHGRVNRVEKKQSWMLGVGSTLMAVVVFASGVLTKMFGG